MSDGSIPTECSVCRYKSILRFNVCKECDDALWLTQMSKKQHIGCQNHSIYDVKYIKNLLINRANQIKKLKEALDYYTKNPMYIRNDYGNCDEWYAQKAIGVLKELEEM